MNEMLGNQLFMARRYAEAANSLETALEQNTASKPIKRKLIICYAQTGDVERSLALFRELIKEDIQFIIDADPILDDCPCNEIIEQMEKQDDIYLDAIELKIYQGIIWLYCDPEKALSRFLEARELDTSNKIVDNVIEQIESYLEQQKSNH